MARSYGSGQETFAPTSNIETQEDEFAYRKGLKRRYRDQVEALVTGEPYDAAKKAVGDEMRRQGAQALATSGTRNIGAVTDLTERMARQAAGQMANLELDKFEGGLRGLEPLQEMDTAQSEKDKKQREYAVAIRDYARKSGALGLGIIGEQEETAGFIEDLLRTEKDPALQQYLREKLIAVRGGNETIEKWDV